MFFSWLCLACPFWASLKDSEAPLLQGPNKILLYIFFINVPYKAWVKDHVIHPMSDIQYRPNKTDEIPVHTDVECSAISFFYNQNLVRGWLRCRCLFWLMNKAHTHTHTHTCKNTDLMAPILPFSINSSTVTLISWRYNLAYRVLLFTLFLNQLTAWPVQTVPSAGLTWREPWHIILYSTLV